MSFPLNDLRTTLAAMAVARGWTQVVWTDAPPDSATNHKSFSFEDPTRSDAEALTSAGGIYTYKWTVQFVWHVDPHSETSATDAVQLAQDVMDELEFTSNWPANVLFIGGERKEQFRTGPETDARTVVLRGRYCATVYEAAPV